MIVASTGDIHLTEGERCDRTVEVMEWVIDDAAARGAKLVLFGGDFTGTTVPHRATPVEKHLLAVLVRRAIEKSMEVAMGRGNHDFLLDYDLFQFMGAHYFTQPGVLALDELDTTVVMAPYPFKHQWLTERLASIEEQNAHAAENYLAELRRMVTMAKVHGKPILLDGHFNVVGAQTGGGEVLSGHEVELTEDQVLSLGCDLYVVHHIHKAQDLGGGRIHFAGSPIAQTWGEQADRKCYLLIDTERGVVERRYTPAPVLWTLEAKYEDGGWVVGWPLDESFLAGSECRLHTVVPEESAATADPSSIEAELRRRGVAMVKLDPQIIPLTRVRSEAIARAESTHDKLNAWCDAQDPPIDLPRRGLLHANLAELEAPAA